MLNQNAIRNIWHLWINTDFHFKSVISPCHKIKRGLCILYVKKDTSNVHIGSTLCLRTTLRKYNAGGYASGTHIAMYLKTFVLIAYICGLERIRRWYNILKINGYINSINMYWNELETTNIQFVMTMNWNLFIY